MLHNYKFGLNSQNTRITCYREDSVYRFPVFPHADPLCGSPLCILMQLQKVPQGINKTLSFNLCLKKKFLLPKSHIFHEGMDCLSCLPLCLQQCLVLTHSLISAENLSLNFPPCHPTPLHPPKGRKTFFPCVLIALNLNLRFSKARAYFLLGNI